MELSFYAIIGLSGLITCTVAIFLDTSTESKRQNKRLVFGIGASLVALSLLLIANYYYYKFKLEENSNKNIIDFYEHEYPNIDNFENTASLSNKADQEVLFTFDQ